MIEIDKGYFESIRFKSMYMVNCVLKFELNGLSFRLLNDGDCIYIIGVHCSKMFTVDDLENMYLFLRNEVLEELNYIKESCVMIL